MLERDVVQKIRLFLRQEFGATVHKYHGSVYGENGHPDLYGTLPGGRAFYFEVKLPETALTVSPSQRRFLALEKSAGALVGVVTSVEETEQLLSTT